MPIEPNAIVACHRCPGVLKPFAPGTLFLPAIGWFCERCAKAVRLEREQLPKATRVNRRECR